MRNGGNNVKRAFVIFLLAVLLLQLCSCAKESVEFESGTVLFNVYTSGLGNIKFSPGPDWTFYTPEDIETANENNGSDSVLDMSAHDKYANIYVDVIFIPTDTYVGSETMTVDEYIEKLVEANNETGKASLSRKGKAKISGNEYMSVSGAVSIGDEDAYQYYYIRKIDGYFVSVNALVRKNAASERDLLDLFE